MKSISGRFPLLSVMTVFSSGVALHSATAAIADEVAYLVYYADDACQELAAVKGFLSHHPFQLVRATGEGVSCHDAMVCCLDKTGPACSSLLSVGGAGSLQDVANFTIEVRGSEVYGCDDSNVDRPECEVIESAECTASSVYNCHFRWATGPALEADPEYFVPSSVGVVDDHAYLAYYNNGDCTDLAGIRGFVSESPVDLTRVTEGDSCDAAMACFLQPDGEACQELPTGSSATVVIETHENVNDGLDVYECDTGRFLFRRFACVVGANNRSN